MLEKSNENVPWGDNFQCHVVFVLSKCVKLLMGVKGIGSPTTRFYQKKVLSTSSKSKGIDGRKAVDLNFVEADFPTLTLNRYL